MNEFTVEITAKIKGVFFAESAQQARTIAKAFTEHCAKQDFSKPAPPFDQVFVAEREFKSAFSAESVCNCRIVRAI